MLYDDLRGIHEDLERLEAGIADRVLEDPKLKVGDTSIMRSTRQGLQLTEACQITTRA
jgi:hypothetical protein